jgi:hypothetical protein
MFDRPIMGAKLAYFHRRTLGLLQVPRLIVRFVRAGAGRCFRRRDLAFHLLRDVASFRLSSPLRIDVVFEA